MANNFGDRLKELRTDKNVSQVQLAYDINVSKGIISLWENGLREPTLSNLLALSNYFEVTLDDLVGRQDYK